MCQGDTAFCQGAQLMAIEPPPFFPSCRPLRRSCSSRLGLRWYSTGARVSDQGCPAARESLWHWGAEPDFIVVVHVGLVAIFLVQRLFPRFQIFLVYRASGQRVDTFGRELSL